MGSVYKKSYTKPLPEGAEFFTRRGERFARWRDAKGRTQTAPVTIPSKGPNQGQPRIVLESSMYYAKYRDGAELVCEVPTGCRDEMAARHVLGELETRADKVRSGIRSRGEDAVIDHQATPLAEHCDAYLLNLVAQGTSPVHRDNVKRCLDRVAGDCGFNRLADLKRDALERWLVLQAKPTEAGKKGMGARTRNIYRACWVAFCNWCLATDRLLVNPLAKVAKADEESDPRRKRRSMTEGELARLLDGARRRPLAEYGRATVRKDEGQRKGKRDTWKAEPLTYANLDAATERARERLKDNPALVARLERLGRQRALIYKALVLTGLRRGELASLTVGQLVLDGPHPHAVLHAADEKNREGSQIAIRADLAADLARWVAELRDARASDSEAVAGRVGPNVAPALDAALPADTPLFNVPDKLVKVLDRDLKAAGIAKIDDRGRTLDVHALRHSFGTLLSKGGVAPRTAQAAMRHASIDLTMNVYTDPRLLDVQAALDALPALPLGSEHTNIPAKLTRTGTDDLPTSALAPGLALTTGFRGQIEASAAKPADDSDTRTGTLRITASDAAAKRKHPLPLADNGCSTERAKRLELSTSSLGSTIVNRVIASTCSKTKGYDSSCLAEF
ncbi:MAG: tyrosine-type recombinase/integrase [Pirellulales bacterium]